MMIRQPTDHLFDRSAIGIAVHPAPLPAQNALTKPYEILPSNGPPVNGITLWAGVYLGDEPGVHSMQLLAQLRLQGQAK